MSSFPILGSLQPLTTCVRGGLLPSPDRMAATAGATADVIADGAVSDRAEVLLDNRPVDDHRFQARIAVEDPGEVVTRGFEAGISGTAAEAATKLASKVVDRPSVLLREVHELAEGDAVDQLSASALLPVRLLSGFCPRTLPNRAQRGPSRRVKSARFSWVWLGGAGLSPAPFSNGIQEVEGSTPFSSTVEKNSNRILLP